MKSMFRRRPSPAMLVAIAALIVALGGTAIAANTIRSGDIVNGQVRTADLADGAVTSAKVHHRTLTATDLHIRSVGTAEEAPLPAIEAYMKSGLVVGGNDQLTPTGFQGETFETADMHQKNSMFVIAPVPGIYRATLHVDWIGHGSPTTLPVGTDCTVQLLRGTPVDYSVVASARGDCSGGKSIEVNRAVRMFSRPKTFFAVISQDSGSDFTLDGTVHPIYLDLTWMGPPGP